MQIKYLLLIFFVTLSSLAFSQNADSVSRKDTVIKTLTPKQARKEKDSILKNTPPPDGNAVVFILRPSTLGFAISMRLDCDSFLVGWVAAKTYLYTVLDSGDHIFKALSENEFHLKIHLEAGKIYYIEQEVKMGFAFARTKLKILNDEEGKKYLSKCIISKHNRYPSFPYSKDVESSPPHED